MPLAPRRVVTWDKVQRINRHIDIWKDKDSIVHRLPDHYKRRYWQNILSERRPVHYNPPTVRYEWDETKNERVENEHYPILPIHPPEADQGLWAGEGVLKGYWLSEPDKRRKYRPQMWVPFYRYPDLFKRVYYSEILDRYMLFWTTITAHRRIDECQGIDYYLLKTSELDLDSKLANKLKRELYISLAHGADCHTDGEKKKYILEKYAEFVLPEEDAEWIALDLNEACSKQQDRDESESNCPLPLKVKFEKEMLQRFKLKPPEESVEAEPGAVEKATSFWRRLTSRRSQAKKS